MTSSSKYYDSFMLDVIFIFTKRPNFALLTYIFVQYYMVWDGSTVLCLQRYYTGTRR